MKPTSDPIIEVRCGDGQWVYAQYLDIDMSDEPIYRSYLSAPAWEIADCYEWWGDYDRDDIELRVNGVVQPSLNYIWVWRWDPPGLEDLYRSSHAVASIKSTWDSDLVWGVNAGWKHWAPREDWWVGAQVSRAGKTTLVDGRIVNILPIFRDWNVYPEVDACPFGFGNCAWDLVFEASTSENLLGAGIYSSQGDFVGQVVGNDFDSDLNGGNPRLWYVLGKPALCLIVVYCNTNPEDIWVEYQQIPPVITTVTATGSGAKVTWNKAKEFGREQRGEYWVQAYPGGESCYADQGDNYCTVGGLEEGVTYRFRVYATGTFSVSRSELSSAVTVQPAAPAPPRGGGVQLETVSRGQTAWVVYIYGATKDSEDDFELFTPATLFQYRVGDGPWLDAQLDSRNPNESRVVSSFKFIEPATVSVRAVNSQGFSSVSEIPVRPLSVRNLRATFKKGNVIVRWKPPASPSESKALKYQYRVDNARWKTTKRTRIVLRGSANQNIRIQVRAVNQYLESEESIVVFRGR